MTSAKPYAMQMLDRSKRFAWRLFALIALLIATPLRAADRPNILFIAVDDLRTTVGCYGDPVAQTPHLDAFAKTARQFDRAYCQQAVCCPSRSSILTGRRPDSIKVWNLTTHFRNTTPDVVTLPEYFKNNGYKAVSFGKIYHGERPMADPQSWSVPERFEYTTRADDYQQPENKTGKGKKVALEVTDAPDDAYSDGKIAAAAIEELAAKHDQPLFLAVGFRKPHLPFTAPRKYWDLYPDESKTAVGLPANPVPDASIPTIALHDSAELRGYSDIPDVGPLDDAQIKALRRGYYACVSFTDAQVGRVLDALEKSGQASNTIVVIWSDHGYHLGEKSLWCKTTNYELDTRVPFMIRVPGMRDAGKASESLVELLDIYPTLVDLAGLPAAPKVEGVSLKPTIDDPTARVKDVAYSEFQRPFRAGGGFDVMGWTARTADWRYVEWHNVNTREIVARELYDERNDAAEMHNLADKPEQRERVEAMSKLLKIPDPLPTTRPTKKPATAAGEG